MLLLGMGDVHADDRQPVNRIDNYFDVLMWKLEYVFNFAKENDIEYVLCPGDLLNRPAVSYRVVIALAGLIQKYRIKKEKKVREENSRNQTQSI